MISSPACELQSISLSQTQPDVFISLCSLKTGMKMCFQGVLREYHRRQCLSPSLGSWRCAMESQSQSAV